MRLESDSSRLHEAARKVETAEAERARLDALKVGYSELKAHETRLVAAAAIHPAANFEHVALARTQLEVVRDILASFPEEVAAGWRPPLDDGDIRRRRDIERLMSRARDLRAMADRIEQHDVPGLDIRLNSVPTGRELGAWRDFPDPAERHYNLIREQREAKVIECKKLRAEADELEEKAERERGRAQ